MTVEAAAKRFEEIGTRLTVGARSRPPRRRRGEVVPSLTIDVRKDKKGEYFLVQRDDAVDLEVLQCDAKDRHLVLLARVGSDKLRYLCGHDERHYFVSQIPEAVTTVAEAKAALRPNELRDVSLRRKERGRRKIGAWIRQGEWFFLPMPGFEPSGPVHPNEPLQRNATSKPHIAEECYRSGGETVYIGTYMRIPRPESKPGTVQLSSDQYAALGEKERKERMWRTMTSGADVYVRGKIRHTDHATIDLDCWHRVLINGEGLVRWETVAFLD